MSMRYVAASAAYTATLAEERRRTLPADGCLPVYVVERSSSGGNKDMVVKNGNRDLYHCSSVETADGCELRLSTAGDARQNAALASAKVKAEGSIQIRLGDAGTDNMQLWQSVTVEKTPRRALSFSTLTCAKSRQWAWENTAGKGKIGRLLGRHEVYLLKDKPTGKSMAVMMLSGRMDGGVGQFRWFAAFEKEEEVLIMMAMLAELSLVAS